MIHESNSVATEIDGGSKVKSNTQVIKYRIGDLERTKVELQLGNTITLSVVKPGD